MSGSGRQSKGTEKDRDAASYRCLRMVQSDMWISEHFWHGKYCSPGTGMGMALNIVDIQNEWMSSYNEL